MKRRVSLSAVLLYVAVAIALVACASGQFAYNAASQAYDASGRTYATAQGKILAAGNAGHITAVQHVTYNALQSAVIAAMTPVSAALTTWRNDPAHVEPAGYDALKAKLDTAVAAVVAFQKEVAP